MTGRVATSMAVFAALALAACGGSSATPTPASTPMSTVAPTGAPDASLAGNEASPGGSPGTPGDSPVTGPTGAALEGVEWLLAEMSDGSEMSAIPPDVRATLTLVNGIALGESGCNTFNGTYTINADEIVFGRFASTREVCDDEAMLVESNYLDALSFVARFGVRETGLLLVSPPGAPLLAYVPAPARALDGAWTVTALQDDQGAIQAPIAGSRLETTFSEDGTLSGHDGCNDFSGTWVAEGPRIVIGGLAGTRAACTDQALADQEEQFLAALQASTIWTTTETELTFRGDDGVQTLTYAKAD